MSFLHPTAAAEIRSHLFAKVPVGPLSPLCASPPTEEVEDGLGGLSDLGRPVLPRNVVPKKALQVRIRAAVEKVAGQTRKPVRLGRLTLLGLLLVQLARVSDFLVGGSCILQGGPFFPIQFLCVASDCGCMVLMSPLFLQRLGGYSPFFEYLGPMMTGVAALTSVDMAAFAAFLLLGLRIPVSPGKLRDSDAERLTDIIFANLGVFELTMAGSVCLQVALVVCSWRIYVSVREAGLYPAGDPARPLTKVTIREVFCDEAENGECSFEWCGADNAQGASESPRGAAEQKSPRPHEHGPKEDGSTASPSTSAMASTPAPTVESSSPSP